MPSLLVPSAIFRLKGGERGRGLRGGLAGPECFSQAAVPRPRPWFLKAPGQSHSCELQQHRPSLCHAPAAAQLPFLSWRPPSPTPSVIPFSMFLSWSHFPTEASRSQPWEPPPVLLHSAFGLFPTVPLWSTGSNPFPRADLIPPGVSDSQPPKPEQQFPSIF